MKKDKLGKFVKIKTGKLDANASSLDGIYPFFTCSKEPLKISSYSYDCRCVLVAGNGDLNVKYYEGKFDAYQRTYIIESIDESILDIRYLYWFLSKYVEKLRELSIGGVIKYIKLNNLTDPIILLPPLKDQKRIVKILDAADALCHKRKQAITLLDDYLKSVFLEMFGDLFKNEKKWKFFEFENYVTLLTDYHANGSYEVLRDNVKLFLEPNHALMVRTTDLENNNYTNDVNYIDEHAYNFLSKSKVFGGEIIINKIGSAGKIYLMPKLDRPVSLGMNAFLLRFKDGVNVNFIYYLLTSAYGKAIIQKKVKGAVTKTIRKDAVRSLLVPEISPDLQNKFSVIFEKTESIKQKMLIQLQELEICFQALMQKAFKGEL